MTRSRYGRSSYDEGYGRESYGDPRRGGGRPRGPGSGGKCNMCTKQKQTRS